jgi:predicted membrane chloride channel (bestrophin family)
MHQIIFTRFSSLLPEIEEENMFNLIWTAVVVLVILWLLGFSIHIGGSLIHLLLVLALIGVIYNLLVGRRII